VDRCDTELPRQPICAALARRVAEREYGGVLERRALDDLKLVVSELVDNAYVHGTGTIRLVLARHDERIRVEVMDEGRDAVIAIKALAGRAGGHGLRLVDHLTERWGAFAGSTHVWAEVPLAPDLVRA
jgi:anti-sigma regulatory factor (Ser/Thr protein kinase)